MNLPGVHVAVFLGVAAVMNAQPEPSEDRTTVVFVCEHGSVKSVLARLLLEEAAADAGLSLDIVSRGMNPDPEVPEWFQEKLEADGRAVGAFRPSPVSSEDVERAEHLVTFDVDVATRPGSATTEVHRWDGLPSVSADYGKGRDAIKARVDELVRSLKEKRPK